VVRKTQVFSPAALCFVRCDFAESLKLKAPRSGSPGRLSCRRNRFRIDRRSSAGAGNTLNPRGSRSPRRPPVHIRIGAGNRRFIRDEDTQRFGTSIERRFSRAGAAECLYCGQGSSSNIPSSKRFATSGPASFIVTHTMWSNSHCSNPASCSLAPVVARM